MHTEINQRDIDGFPRWTWMNNGMNCDFLAAFLRIYPDMAEAPTKYETLGGILEDLRTGERYALQVLEVQEDTEKRRERFEKAMRRNNVSTTRNNQCLNQK